VRKLRMPKAAWPRHPSGARAALEAEGNHQFMASGEVQSAAGAATGEERRTSTEAVLKYLSKVPILACRGGVADADGGPADDASPPPHRPQAAAVLPGRKSRGESETGLRPQACRRRLGIGRSSAAVAALAPRRDDSLVQAQDGIASAIAYCKLSLSPSRGTPLLTRYVRVGFGPHHAVTLRF